MWRLWCGGALCAAGCVSSGTWSAYSEIERELETDVRAADGSSCAELAAEVAATFPVARSMARAELARGRSESALPAPELMLEVWDFPIGDPQLADREGMYMVGLEQEIPPGLDARARAGAERAREALAMSSDRTRMIRARALETCVEWAASELEAARVREVEALAGSMRELLVARMPTGDGLAEIARVEAEAARLERMRVEAEARSARARAQLSAWLDRELGAPPSIEPAREADADAIIADAVDARGSIRAARARARAAEAMADAANEESLVPTFRVRVTYMQMPSMRPGLGAAVGMTLPWLYSGEGAARDAARAEADAAREEAEALERELRAEVRSAAASLQANARALAILRERERPAAERAIEAVRAALATGGAEIDDWLAAMERVRELEVEETRLIREAAMARAALEGAR